MIRTLQYTVSSAYDAITVYRFLQEMEFSAHNIKDLKKIPGSLLQNGSPVFTNQHIHNGDILTVTLTENENSPNVKPMPLPLDIVYGDEDILVVNKPADMPVHPSQNHYENTLANAVSHYEHEQGNSCVFRCITRLDRDTTGLVLIARHSLSASILGSMMNRGEIRREYLAVVMGIPFPETGRIDAPIGRVTGSTIERRIDPLSGEHAVTHYRVLDSDRSKNISLLRLSLETGRTHQIRVHMKSIGHPLPGDFLYCPDYSLISRQALHSCFIRFIHPIKKAPIVLEAPLPNDISGLFPGIRPFSEPF